MQDGVYAPHKWSSIIINLCKTQTQTTSHVCRGYSRMWEPWIIPSSQSSLMFVFTQVVTGTCHLLGWSPAAPVRGGFSSETDCRDSVRSVKTRKSHRCWRPQIFCPCRSQCGTPARAWGPGGEHWRGRFSARWPVLDDSTSGWYHYQTAPNITYVSDNLIIFPKYKPQCDFWKVKHLLAALFWVTEDYSVTNVKVLFYFIS